MAVTADILRSYTRPRDVMRRQLLTGSEERALIFVMAACILFFVARLPALVRDPQVADPDIGFIGLAAGYLLGTVFIAPLMFYGLAALSHLLARVFGGQGTWLGARLALFWALLVAVPMVLLHGLVAAFLGLGPVATALSWFFGLIFVLIWMQNLRVAEGAT